MHLRRYTLERVLGVDWHGLAMNLSQICPKKSDRKLGQSLGRGGVPGRQLLTANFRGHYHTT